MSAVTIENIASSVEQFSTKANSEIQSLKDKYHTLQTDMIEIAQKQTVGKMPGTGDPLTKALRDERLLAFKSDRGMRMASIPVAASLTALLTKTAITGDLQSTTDQYAVQAQRDPRLGEFSMRPLSILEALPRLPISSNTLEYNQLDNYSNAAAIQSVEGATLAQGAMPTQLKTAKVATIAHWLQVSEQVLSDEPVLRQQMDSLLRYGCMGKASAEIIGGSGVIEGLETAATAFTAATDSFAADAIAQAQTQLQINGWQPDTVVMHPTLWNSIRTDRSATEGLYVVGNWSQPAGSTLWGMRLVLDASVSATQPLVLDSTQCAILDRQDARVELGRAGNDFTTGLLTLRAMIRIGLAVFSPSAVLQVSIP